MSGKKGMIFLLLLLGISVVVNGYFLLSTSTAKLSSSDQNTAALRKKYPYLSQKVLTEYNKDILINFYDLRETLDTQIAPYKNTFGLYFEYLPTGTNIGINEDAHFYAASLIKVPIVMAYYHQKHRLGIKGDEEVTIEEKDLNKNFGDLWKRGAGTRIKMSEAIRLALTESDNTAADVILHRMKEEDFLKVYEGLDIPLQDENSESMMTTEQYSSILKALYYSSELPIDDSNEILGFLSETKFRDKLPAGVPADIQVAHKVGILGEELYQDCGIIYIPRRPYMVCMISSSDNKTATERMSSVSKTIYDFVSSANTK